MFSSSRGWLWAAALALVIVIASAQSRVASPPVVNFDKAVHTLVYGLLATLVVRNLAGRHRVWLVIVVVSLFGASDEWHQRFVPGRRGGAADWAADTAGAALAALAYTRWAGYRRLLERPLGKLAKVAD